MIGPPGPAYGDTISGTNLAGGIAAALLKRERTGEPSTVDVSLLRLASILVAASSNLLLYVGSKKKVVIGTTEMTKPDAMAS